MPLSEKVRVEIFIPDLHDPHTLENPLTGCENLLHQADELATKWESWYNKNSSDFGKALN